MAAYNAELQARLEELERELEDGDITQKGYEKRRTMLLSQYLGPDQSLLVPNRGSTNHSPASSQRPISVSSTALNSPDRASFPRGIPQVYIQESADVRPAGYGSMQGAARHLPDMKSFTNRDSLYLPGPSDSGGSSFADSRAQTMARSDYAFNPAEHPDQDVGLPMEPASADDQSRMSTLVDSQQEYFEDFTGQQMQEQSRDSYGGNQRYSGIDAMSPAGIHPRLDLPTPPVLHPQLPLEPRDIPFAIVDPHNSKIQMSKFENIGAVLRHRGQNNAKQPAYWILDSKGKETASITWEKLASRAEKVAQVIKDKSNLYRGDRVALIYRDTELIEFAIALMGCFLAGVVAVPITCVDDYGKLTLLLQTTQAHLALTTDNNLKAFQRDIITHKLKWPHGVEWWKTTEFGSYHTKKKDDTQPLQLPDLAYIEFSRAPTGDLRGVVLSHRTIMHQMASVSALVASIPKTKPPESGGQAGYLYAMSRHTETILSYLDPRDGIGLVMGVLFGVYGGHTTVWMEAKTVDTAGLYAHLITRYRATVMVADYSRLKFAAYNYQQDPMTTRNFKKGLDPNFSSVKICLIDTLTVDCEFHEILADRWFKPMRNERAREVVAPMLCLPEHGGMIISVRDWLGGEERMGCPLSIEPDDEPNAGMDSSKDGNTKSNGTKRQPVKEARTSLSEVLLDKEALKSNEVQVLAMGEEAKRRAHEPGTIRVGAFGFPIADATMAIVDPETSLLCPPLSIGEIWIDSPSLSGGFWSLPRHTETIFHARPYRFVEGSPTPQLLDLEFLRSGLLGFILEGKIYVLGLYEDRIRQKIEWTEDGVHQAEHRYFFVQHLISTIMRNIPKIHDCSAFDVYVNGEYLPIILIETFAASTAPLVPGGPPRQLDIPLLDSLSERCMDLLFQEHHLRVYCVMITAPNILPKVMKNGRKEIGNMLCRKEFDNGSLPCVHVQFGVERAVQNLPMGDDPAGGIWSPLSSQIRIEMLAMQEKQYSGVDHREVVMDDRTSTALNQFTNIFDLLQWRVSRQAEELSYCTVDGRGREGKGLNWKKLDLRVAAIAMYLKNKVKIQPGDHLLLMYTHSEDFVAAIYACFCIGAVAIPMAPLDQNRLGEDSPALLSMVADYRIKAILVNNDVDQLLKLKPLSQHLKQSAMILKINVPNIYNTSKPPKQSHGCRELGLSVRPQWAKKGFPVLIWIYWTPDQRRVAVQLGHDTVMALCKVQKETCQMTSTRPVVSCVRSTMGLGFIHMCMMGVYLGAPTYLVSPVDFAQNPASLFLSLARYKVKDTYATAQMLDHAMASMSGKGFVLQELKNLMIATDARPRLDIYGRVCRHFAQTGLDRTSINTIYSHVLNPMIASRSYMCIEPIELMLDPRALRRGLIVPIEPEGDPFPVILQDSGMVPVSTQIAIVNPETNCLCHVGEYGEIWVQSEACGFAFYMSKDPLDVERFNGRTVDGDPNAKYVRTGDLGFLHTVSRPIGPGGALVEMQVLFVLGNIGETFDVNGLSYFPMDIENSIEKCHRNIMAGGSAIFQAGGLVVVLVEVFRRNHLASIVPVIVNAVLNAHQLIVDIVAFVERGDFPRSRLGEKQRGKILANWVTRRMHTIAQFGIKDPTAAPSDATPRNSSASIRRNGSTRGASSLRHVESNLGVSDMLPEEDGEQLASMDNSSILESPLLEQDEHVMQQQQQRYDGGDFSADLVSQLQLDITPPNFDYNYSPLDTPGQNPYFEPEPVSPIEEDHEYEQQMQQSQMQTEYADDPRPAPARYGTKPVLSGVSPISADGVWIPPRSSLRVTNQSNDSLEKMASISPQQSQQQFTIQEQGQSHFQQYSQQQNVPQQRSSSLQYQSQPVQQYQPQPAQQFQTQLAPQYQNQPVQQYQPMQRQSQTQQPQQHIRQQSQDSQIYHSQAVQQEQRQQLQQQQQQQAQSHRRQPSQESQQYPIPPLQQTSTQPQQLPPQPHRRQQSQTSQQYQMPQEQQQPIMQQQPAQPQQHRRQASQGSQQYQPGTQPIQQQQRQFQPAQSAAQQYQQYPPGQAQAQAPMSLQPQRNQEVPVQVQSSVSPARYYSAPRR